MNLLTKLKSTTKLLQEYATIKNSGLFDRSYYLGKYPIVGRTKQNPIIHYLKTGWRNGKDPSPDFKTIYYLNKYPDVRGTGVNPLVHYIRFGKDEGRIPHPSIGAKYKGYGEWVQKYDILTKSDRALIRFKIAKFTRSPTISIIMSVQKGQQQWLQEVLESVIAQIYTKWMLFVVCDPQIKSQINPFLKDYQVRDSRISLSHANPEDNFSKHLQTALGACRGEFFTHLPASDKLTEHALYLVANEINHFPQADAIYSDEDKLNQHGERCDPYFKPDWNPDLFKSQNLFSHIGVFKIDLAKKVGGFRGESGGDPDWDLAMRLTETIPKSHIRHIQQICVHRHQAEEVRFGNEKDPGSAEDSHYQTLISHFKRTNKKVDIVSTDGPYWRLKYLLPNPNPLVSILIPTKNQQILLDQCLNSIQKKTRYPNYEILVINNQSDDPQTLNYLHQLKQEKSITLQNYNHPFNYSAINNFAAQHANGDVLVFLNDDIEIISSDWLDEIVSHACREEIGAVGAMLYFPTNLIQHAGIVLFPDIIAGHAFYMQARGAYGQNDRARLVQNYSAITGACMAIEKSKFFEVGGFDEVNLPIAYNDVDLCLRLMQAGYYNLWTPHAELYHSESVSRGLDNTPEKLNRLKQETDYMLKTWGPLISNDRAYHPNFKSYPFFSLADPPRSKKPWE